MNEKNNSLRLRIVALLIGLLVNAIANSLTISTNMGTSQWTAAEVNLAQLFNIPVGWPIFLVGVLTIFANQLLIGHFDKVSFFGELFFITCFSYFVNIFVAFFNQMGVPTLPVWLRIVLCFGGIFSFCCGISFYQRANLFMHPNDNTTNILRFKFFKGNIIRAQLANFLVPTIIIIFCFLFTHQVYSINIGTIVCLFANGSLIKIADKYFWHRLHHNFRVFKAIRH